jgi:hypothetical protein
MGDEIEKFEKDMRYEMQCKKDEYFCYHSASFFLKKRATNDVIDRKSIYKLNKSGVFLPPLLTRPLTW